MELVKHLQQKWEYRVIELAEENEDEEHVLDQLGNSGWELVSAQYLSNRGCCICILKRPK